MSHTKGLAEVKELPCSKGGTMKFLLVSGTGIAVMCGKVGGAKVEEGNAHRLAALWNMAERLGLSTERIARMEHVFKAAPHLFITLQNVRNELSTYPHCPFCGTVHGEGHKEDCIGYEVDEAIQKARGEE